jgi:predicted ester cyclase
VLGRGTFERVEPIWRQLIEGYGMQLTIEELIAEGPVVAARYRETGRIRRRWGARDAASQDRQLGIPLE